MVPEVTQAFEHNEPFWVVDPDLKVYAMPHNEENTSFAVSTNSDGLRTSIEVTDSKKTLRVMTLGCSTTFGWGVADSETYPARLQHYLTEAGYGNVEVVNAGQPGYTSFQGDWLWDALLDDYNPMLSWLGILFKMLEKRLILIKVKRFYKGTIDF